MAVGMVGSEGFAIDTSVMEADAGRYHGIAPEEIDVDVIGNPQVLLM
ncbi:MAG: hypothetical protein ACI9MJ_001061 [Alphaproteobacteria bacterium]|jgi:hypothetical protein